MKIKLFTIPVFKYEEEEKELNEFLEAHQIKKIEKKFYQYNTGAFWCFIIEYSDGKEIKQPISLAENNRKSGKIDYKATLSDKHFEIFSKLREVRREIAIKEAIPAYAVFTDAELAGIAALDILTEEQIRTVKGVGDKKAERFAKRIIDGFKSKSE